MLFLITALVDFVAMSLTLWLGLYLLGRSFPHPIAMRAVVMLLALSVFFLGAFFNLFHQVVGTAAWRAVMLIIGLGCWYSLVCQLNSREKRLRWLWLEIGIYGLGGIAALLLLANRSAFVGEQGNLLHVAHMGLGLPYTVYGLFQILVSLALLFNLLGGNHVGLTPQGRHFLAASFFPILAVGYGVTGLISPVPLPRLGQDILTFCGVFLVGLAVAWHQEMVERRVSGPDFPLNGLTILGLSSLYAGLAWYFGVEPERVALVMLLAICTHAFSDFARQFLDRLRLRQDNSLRRKLSRLETEASDSQALNLRIKLSLSLLLQALQASGGFVAVRRGEFFEVIASQNSLSLDSHLAPDLVRAEELAAPADKLAGVAWIAPVFENRAQVAVIGLGKPRLRLDYAEDDLDLLAEVAERMGAILLLQTLQEQTPRQPGSVIAETLEPSAEANAKVDDLVLAITDNPAADFVKIVEDDLRHLFDYTLLGESALIGQLGIAGDSHLERGKALYTLLLAALEALRPAGPRPREPIPRLWFNYVVLYDAYVESVPNREIMARLYISEGTFNRTRRNALRSLARLLLEKRQATPLTTGGSG